jgi:hypothetical protein
MGAEEISSQQRCNATVGVENGSRGTVEGSNQSRLFDTLLDLDCMALPDPLAYTAHLAITTD